MIPAFLHRLPAWIAAVPLLVLACPIAGRAQPFDAYFPSGLSGYDQDLGVTVQARPRPLYEAPGVTVGAFTFRPNLDQSFFYNSNINGLPNSGTWGSETSANASIASDWGRNNLSATAGVQRFQFFQLPTESYTNWNAGISGGYTIYDSDLQVSYSHQTYNQLGTTLGVVASSTPILDYTDTGDIHYTFNLNRLSITPDVSFGSYRYGTATISGAQVNLNFLDHNALAGGLTFRYSMSEEGGILFVIQGVATRFNNTQPGQPTNNSNSALAAAGLDYQTEGVWRFQVLVGVESRAFESPVYPSYTTPIVQGNVIWTPSRATTVTGTIARLIEDPQSAGTNGYVSTLAELRVDQEVYHNVILFGEGGVQHATYLTGGSQSYASLGAGITWLMNRYLRLSLEYDGARQFGTSNFATATNPATLTSGEFTQNVVMLTLHFGL
jgi:hypothetical protein